MQRNDVDTELFDLLVRLALLSQQLHEGTLDASVAHIERLDLAWQLRRRGFVIAEA